VIVLVSAPDYRLKTWRKVETWNDQKTWATDLVFMPTSAAISYDGKSWVKL
jgi:hypothetical protein